MAVVPVDIAARPYEVRIEAGLLAELVPHCKVLLRKRDVPIVTDRNVHNAWGDMVDGALRAAGHEPRWRILPAGEESKSWHHLSSLVDWLLDLGVERGDHVLALGGGVIGDLTGFAAAILKRGCNFIQLPTTLLAQVDSSVGGKTAINTGAGKNLVGAFHQPALVLADLAVLDTLPDRELLAGYAEVVKYGLIGDPDFFAWCDANGHALLSGEAEMREYAVATSVRAKARIVAEDERETSGTRALLNLGHTFGHALEAETGFSSILLHGEAVALGMVLAARYSARRGHMAHASAEHVASHLAEAGLRSELTSLGLDCDGRTLVGHMLHDKKMDAGTLPFVLMNGIGKAFLARDVDLDDVSAFLDAELARQ
ncbi:3-dehydroquinate synthase [Novosphingobium marinum]|uniref:3-dehydroquinate synthase n=1 Tax=Novosphingobium marinum TaxID=1514948 RepID=A0A7Y9XU06_9SPHN|nr:3-dehydroquinate synthase [Novosphingobium marinum]NYH94574.1 3-dehydroquinate synthase [Novosphingobium marinum]GGC23369.1 3-dehydroquinate synthase [Novosphingobium marinum]